MNVRRMKTEDLPAVSQIDLLSFSTPWPPAAFEIELDNPISRCWVVDVDTPDATVVAAALVVWRVLDEAHIATIAVHPDFRGQGIGKLLLQTGMKSAYMEGARIYHLEVRDQNQSAQKMYMGFGYEVVGRRRHYYKDTGEDALLMTLDLTRPNPVDPRLDIVPTPALAAGASVPLPDFLMETLDEPTRNTGPE